MYYRVLLFRETFEPMMIIDMWNVSVLQIFEWWYFRKYGTSFIEQVSVSHLRPLLGGVDNSSPNNSNTSNGDTDSSRQSVSGQSSASHYS